MHEARDGIALFACYHPKPFLAERYLKGPTGFGSRIERHLARSWVAGGKLRLIDFALADLIEKDDLNDLCGNRGIDTIIERTTFPLVDSRSHWNLDEGSRHADRSYGSLNASQARKP